MKPTYSLGKFKTTRAFLLMLAMFAIFLSCKKEKNSIQQETQIRSQQSVLMDWGQTANGRWIPYLLDKVKHENPQLDAKGVTEKFFSYVSVVTQAKMDYRRELLTQMGINPLNHPRFLDSLYRANYTTINGSLAEREVMDSLWLRYQAMLVNESGGINQRFPLARLTYDPPEVTACAIPDLLRAYFTDLLLLPNRYNTPIAELLDMMNPDISGCNNAYATQVGALVADMLYLQNPDAGTCHSYQFQIETAFQQWLDCPPPPQDPEPPGSGGGGGGGTSPPDPYPPVAEPDFTELNVDPCQSKNIINNDGGYFGTMHALSQVKAKLGELYEWGAKITISDFSSANTMDTQAPYTSGFSNKWNYSFVWDRRNNIYTIATVHTHHNDGAPSLQDIYNLAENMKTVAGMNHTAGTKYLADHGAVYIVNASFNYAITVQDWPLMMQKLDSFNSDKAGAHLHHLTRTSALLSQEKAILEHFGTAINLMKSSSSGSNIFSPVTLGANNEVVWIPCN